MKIFLAGAGGAIGRRLTPQLVAAGHQVIGTTRAPDKAEALRAFGAEPVVVDVFDAAALMNAVGAARPDAVIHMLTDLAHGPGSPRHEEGLALNARIRVEGTRNLVAAALGAGVRRMIAQSIAFIYAPSPGVRVESDPLLPKDGSKGITVAGVEALETAVLAMPEGVVLRFGLFYGPGTWSAAPMPPTSVHVDAAAQATLLALEAASGIYNIADDAADVSSEKAKRAFGFDAAFRLSP